VTGGLTALIASWVLGPRKGRFVQEPGSRLHQPNPLRGYSVPLQALGTLLLWFGWYGFNVGGIRFISTEGYATVAALAAVTTTLGAASGAISSLFLSAYLSLQSTGEVAFDVGYALNGCLSGLVAVTGACAVVEPWAGLAIGSVAGMLYVSGSRLLSYHQIDDAVDAIPVHLFNGAWGVLAVGLFASPERLDAVYHHSEHVGWFYSWGRGSTDAALLAANVVGLLFIAGFVAVVLTPFFFFLLCMGWFRADPLEEIIGLDFRCRVSADSVGGDDSSTAVRNEEVVVELGKANGRYLHHLEQPNHEVKSSTRNVASFDDLELIDPTETDCGRDSNETIQSARY
jgi:ammonium transporter, Amt family